MKIVFSTKYIINTYTYWYDISANDENILAKAIQIILCSKLAHKPTDVMNITAEIVPIPINDLCNWKCSIMSYLASK